MQYQWKKPYSRDFKGDCPTVKALPCWARIVVDLLESLAISPFPLKAAGHVRLVRGERVLHRPGHGQDGREDAVRTREGVAPYGAPVPAPWPVASP